MRSVIGERIIDKIFPVEVAHAHCDIPCGIYDAFPAGLAARTVQTMVKKILELKHVGHEEDLKKHLNYHNTLTRMINTKEEHAQICKKELLILWTDYFKPKHLEKWPDLHTKFWNATKLCSKNKQNVDPEAAQQLIDAVHEISHIFEEAEKGK